MGEPSKITRPSVNLLIQELLPDRDGSLKHLVVVADDCPTCTIVIPVLGYQKIHSPASFRKFLQGVNLGGVEWLPPNQASRLSNLQNYWVFFVSGIPIFSRQVRGGVINRDRTVVLIYVGFAVKKIRGRHVSYQLVYH